MADNRSYLLVPDDGEGSVVRCVRCDREIRAGQPFVLLPDPRTDEEGNHLAATVCVYCE